MASNWRATVGKIGMLGPPFSVFEPDSYVTLAARLITPIPDFPRPLKWVYQKWTPYGMRGGLLQASVLDDEQAGFSTGSFLGTFPYGYAVYPDT